MTKTAVGLIGLGKISSVHLAALGGMPEVEVVGGYDSEPGRTLAFRSQPRPVYDSVAELLSAGPSTVIVSTPTPVHAASYKQVLDHCASPVKVLIEKPLAMSLGDVADMLSPHTQLEIIGLYHAAHAPEVLWAAGNVPGWRSRFGGMISYEASFADPYSQANAHVTHALVNSWVDSGINALTVALRLLDLMAVDQLIAHDRKGYRFDARLLFREDGSETVGTIHTDWEVGAAAKRSRFGFADGTQLLLDHQAVRGSLTAAGAIIEEFRYNGTQPRLVSHYFNAFTSLLVDGRGYFSADQSRHLHELLLSSRDALTGVAD